jgi:hypothetical protein
MDYNARIEETVANILAMRSQVTPAQSHAEVAQPQKSSAEVNKPKVSTEEEIAA